MAYSFTQLQDIKNRIVRDLAAQQNQLETAKGAFTTIKTALGTMQTSYAGWASEVDDFLTANPDDPAAQALAAEKDIMVAEFQSSKMEATNLESAVLAV